jgi:hypothetical protein
MKAALPPHGYEGQRASPLPLPARPRVLVVDDLPSAEALALRGLAFEQVHPSHAEPVRLRLHGEGLGIFIDRARAGHVIKSRLSLVLLLAVLALPVDVAADGGAEPSAALLSAASDDEQLHAIALVEDWQGRRGAAGEIGPYQMMPRTWAAYRGSATARARQHLAWLKRELRHVDVDPSPFNLALCWNAGLRATITGRAPERSYDYALRVVAIMESRQ